MATVVVDLDPANVELRFAQGDDALFNIRAELSTAPGTYIDFAGYTSRTAQFYNDPSDSAVLCTGTVTVFDNGGGDRGVTVDVSAANTALLPESCWWDLSMVDTSSNKRTWFAGPVRVKRVFQ